MKKFALGEAFSNTQEWRLFICVLCASVVYTFFFFYKWGRRCEEKRQEKFTILFYLKMHNVHTCTQTYMCYASLFFYFFV